MKPPRSTAPSPSSSPSTDNVIPIAPQSSGSADQRQPDQSDTPLPAPQLFAAFCAQLQHQGVRCLFVLSGDVAWCSEQARAVMHCSKEEESKIKESKIKENKTEKGNIGNNKSQKTNTENSNTSKRIPPNTPLTHHWLWLGDRPEWTPACLTTARQTLAGQEIRHAIFDARRQLDVQALAILAGSLMDGSILLLLAPPWAQWQQQPDGDSCRWNDGQPAIATPHFIHHLQHCLQQDHEVLIWRQGQPFRLPDLQPRPHWQLVNGAPLYGQQQILAQLQQMPAGVAVVSAARGRGKSALAGMLIARWSGPLIVTAPARVNSAVIASHAGEKFHFIAPDALLAAPPPQADWLIIDEAAMLNGAVLQRLIRLYPRTLLTTTLQGYEGTGHGFLLKFCPSVTGLRHYRLQQPVRWAAEDPLERVISRILLLDDENPHQSNAHPPDNAPHQPAENSVTSMLLPVGSPAAHAARHLDPQTILFQHLHLPQGQPASQDLSPHSPLQHSPLQHPPLQHPPLQHPPPASLSSQQLTALYRLLTRAHYRTTPLDLRRMMDAPGQQLAIARAGEQIIAALWTVAEGRLPADISRAVWAGVRRPPGNLVAQSLAAHGNDPLAACLAGLRISRIAVHPAYQRQGIGQRLINWLRESVSHIDYLSVSFGYTEPLYRFWQHCGFRLARIGDKQEASSGCYSAIALYPLTPAGVSLAQGEWQALDRGNAWLPVHITALSHSPLPASPAALPASTPAPSPPLTPHSTDPPLDQQDWLTLAGFAYARRPLTASRAALQRLVSISPLPLPLLRARLHPDVNLRQLCEHAGLCGEKALQTALRGQTAQALQQLDATQSQTLAQRLASWIRQCP